MEFPEPYWSKVSSEAKDFVMGLLKKSPGGRMTSEQALKHVWIVKVKNIFWSMKVKVWSTKVKLRFLAGKFFVTNSH